MKKYLLLLIIPLMMLESCSEDFDINAPYEDVYVLNCILTNDNTVQYAVLSKNCYTENGNAPVSEPMEQNIQGVDIKLFYNDSVFVLRDTTIQINDSGKETKINCYYTKNLTFQPKKNLTIKAFIQDNKVLESTIYIPDISYHFNFEFPQLFKARNINRYLILQEFNWNWVGDYEKIKHIMCLPQLEIYYKKNENGILIDKKINVPLRNYSLYFDPSEILSPVELKYEFNNYCVTNLETINNTMDEISRDDPYKSNYLINKVIFKVTCLDSYFSKYYSALSTYANDFTIKMRPADFSNINGGKGIFGACYTFSKLMVVDKFYIHSFGYHFDPE